MEQVWSRKKTVVSEGVNSVISSRVHCFIHNDSDATQFVHRRCWIVASGIATN